MTSRLDARRLVRFGLVGVLATSINLLTTLGLAQVGVAFGLASLVAFAVSLIASYLGHTLFTFKASAPHLRSVPRFVATTLVLVVVCATSAHVLVEWAQLTPWLVAGGVAIFYPIASYAMHRFYTFTDPDPAEPSDRRRRSTV